MHEPGVQRESPEKRYEFENSYNVGMRKAVSGGDCPEGERRAWEEEWSGVDQESQESTQLMSGFENHK